MHSGQVICFFKCIYFEKERERERERRWEGQREMGRERGPTRFSTVSAESDVGLELKNCEISTGAETESDA